MHLKTLLIVDDSKSERFTTRYFLESALQVQTEEAVSGIEALARLAQTNRLPIDLVLLDYFMPEMDGRQTLRQLRARYPLLPVIMLTAHEKLDDAVSLMREGACDFISKPFNPERLRLAVEKYILGGATRACLPEDGFDTLIGAQTGLSDAVTLGRKAAMSDIPVLITGESGTGKELMARAIHAQSPRRSQPFIAVNCGALTETLAQSALFGHEKGAFTGAVTREIGKFREAEGGTLFLDEVGELKPDTQTRLLRALQAREIEPLGSSRPVKVDVRIISATHRNLGRDTAESLFRQDLYYRLNVFPVRLTALRERLNDVPAIARHILTRLARKENKSDITLGDGALQWLTRQHWAGNVRELENLLHRTLIVTDKTVLEASDLASMAAGDVQDDAETDKRTITLEDEQGHAFTWDEIEARVIASVLRRCGGHVPKAARMLAMGQSTLYKKLAGTGKPS